MFALPTIRRLIPPVTLLLAVALCVTCGGDSSTAPEDDSDAGKPRELTVSLEVSSGPVGTRVKITGIPDDVTSAYGLVTVPGTALSAVKDAAIGGPAATQLPEGTGIAFIRKSDAGHELLVPLHPTAPSAGGTVEIEVTNGDNITSNKVTFDIDALPNKPGAFNELVGKLEALLDSWIDRHGTTVVALRTTPADQLSLFELPLLLIHIAVNHPDNPNSLRAFADGDIPIWQGQVIDRSLLDSFAELSGLSDYFDERSAFVDTVASLPATSAPTVGSMIAHASPHRHDASARICFEAPHFDIGAGDCAKLADVMNYQAELTHENNSAAGKVLDSVRDLALTALGATRAAYAAWAIGNTIWASDTITSGSTGLYPGMFVNDATDYGAGPLIFAEDFTAPGQWSDFHVTAVSEGWRVDKVVRSLYKKVTGVDDETFESDALNDIIGGELSGEVNGAIESSFQDPVYDAVVTELGVEELVTIEYCAQSWNGIDCTGLPYSEGKSPSLDVDCDAKTFEPTEVGTTTLNVGTTGVFGRAQPTSETKEIETRALTVSIDPFQANADVDESVNFTVTVNNAENTEIEWYTEGSLPADVVFNATTASVTTPSDPWNPPITLFARSKANTGLRENIVNSDPREDSSPITFGKGLVIVDPASVCIEPNEDTTFTAALVPGTVESITWRVEPAGAGTITQGGVYTAPGAPRNDQVAVIATVNGSLEGGAIVTVGACDCYWTATVSGAVGATHSGDQTVASYSQGVVTSIGFDEDTFPLRLQAVTPLFSGVGDHDILLYYSHNSYAGDVYSSGLDATLPLPKLYVESFVTGDYISGRIEGQLSQLLSAGPPAVFKHVTVIMSFKSQLWELGEPICGSE